ncbi:hypothetical protein [Chryseobacterium sp. CT-SW4]|uniref:hypothetical protein n=1 Tax=Chryseobacterium sp. SW-1 TaxID=3157343 RepID=UPI003B01FF31
MQLIFKINLEETYPSFNFPGFASLPIKEERYIAFTKTTTQVYFEDGSTESIVKSDYLGKNIPKAIQITLLQNLLFPKKYPVIDERIKTLPLYKKELYLLKKSILNRNIKKVDLAENEKYVKQKLQENFPGKEISRILIVNENKDFDIEDKKITNRVKYDTLLNFKFKNDND